MKKKLFATFLFLGLTLTAFGQGMSDTQILQYVMQQKKLGKAESDIATELLKKGATLEQIQNMRQKYAKQLEQHSMAGEADKAIEASAALFGQGTNKTDIPTITLDKATLTGGLSWIDGGKEVLNH